MVSKFASLLAIATVAISSVATQAPTSNLINGQCVTTYDASIDYFPEKLNTSEDKATFFSIEYHNNYKVVKNSRTGRTYVLVQCGTPSPTDVNNATEIYQIPITKAAAMETTVVPYLEMIGAAESIKLIADGSLISSPCFQKYLNSGDITQLSATNETLQAEQIKNVQVQFGANPYDTVADSNTTVTTAQTYEPDVLGRSSWISYYAAFYNLEAVANNIAKTMTDNYNRLKEAAAHYDTKPVVAWTTYDAPSQYNNNTATYILSEASYKVGLTNDAGATMLNASATTYSSAADLLQAISTVDILIDETFIGSNLTAFLQNYNISEADQSKYKFLTNKKVYREDGILTSSGGYDWFEAPVAMADALLEDMINAVNPNAPSDSYQRNWLRNIVLGEAIKTTTESNCSWTEDAPRPNLATQFNGTTFTLSSTSGANKAMTLNVAGALVAAFATLAYLN
ncbi:hypothetical protein INT46_009995 [Mucor plumbeus]|uniref:Periplasmic binding protein n=1 Tax=Mucor plumbeus TaxID=97098 RepID=A0A8H7V4U2_9FUNG|nr:hypothetical protein INT46_009995 [Mucor plumbeus]